VQQPRPGVLLDVDGTLVDNNYLHTVAWSRAFAQAGEWAPMHAIHRLVGMGSERLVRHLLGHDCPAALEARGPCYRELMGEVRAFPGAADLIQELHAAGLVVVIASSGKADEIEAMVELIGAGDAIDAVTTADDVDQAKPEPDVFEAALKAGNVDDRRALVVGDSVWDAQAARAAGLGFVGVEAGGFSRHELAEEGALYVYRDIAELVRQWRTGPLAALVSV
jgi:HAD superfamily hydrolase (TIGR01509 family)